MSEAEREFLQNFISRLRTLPLISLFIPELWLEGSISQRYTQVFDGVNGRKDNGNGRPREKKERKKIT